MCSIIQVTNMRGLVRCILAILIAGLCTSLLIVGLLRILRHLNYYAADLMSTLVFLPPILIACLAACSLFGVIALAISPIQPWTQIIVASLLCLAALMAIGTEAKHYWLTATVVNTTLTLLVAASVYIGQQLRTDGTIRGAVALLLGIIASFPIPSLSDSLRVWLIRTASGFGAGLMFLSPFVAGLVFGVVAARVAHDQYRTQLACGAVVASALSLPYMFIEGVPLIFPVLPVVIVMFLAGVYLSQRGVAALSPRLN
jgi:hypothetical protein